MIFKKGWIAYFFSIVIVAGIGLEMGQAQPDFNDPVRAKFIFDIAQNITWPNEGYIDTFDLGVLSTDSSLYQAMQQRAGEVGELHTHPIRIKHFHRLEAVQGVELLYINKVDMRLPMEQVLEHISGTHTLLISEKYPFNKSMINFKIQKNFEINPERLRKEGFHLDEMLADMAVKSKSAWQSLYEATETKLDSARRKVARQKAKLDTLKRSVQLHRQELKKQKAAIARQTEYIQQQKEELEQLNKSIEVQREVLGKKSKTLESKQREVAIQEAILNKKKDEIEETRNKIDEQKAVLNQQLAQIKQQRLILYLLGVLFLLIIGLAFFIYRSYKIKKEANKELETKNEAIRQQHAEIQEKSEELAAQRDLATKQRDHIAQQNQSITESIRYASSIQSAILPSLQLLKKHLPRHFILYKPKDIVSGDFYWSTKKDNQLVFTAADCTGHGVPGAMMSMLGIAYLEEIIYNQRDLKAGKVLNQLRDHVIQSLNQAEQEEIKDGMDMALCILDLDTNELQFAGANNPLYVVRRQNADKKSALDASYKQVIQEDKFALYEIPADKQPVGLFYGAEKSFENHSLQLQKDDTLYLFSDGYADQFGGPKNKKFKYNRFREMLINVYDKPMPQQQKILKETIEDWQRDFEQIDDILVMGVRI